MKPTFVRSGSVPRKSSTAGAALRRKPVRFNRILLNRGEFVGSLRGITAGSGVVLLGLRRSPRQHIASIVDIRWRQPGLARIGEIGSRGRARRRASLLALSLLALSLIALSLIALGGRRRGWLPGAPSRSRLLRPGFRSALGRPDVPFERVIDNRFGVCCSGSEAFGGEGSGGESSDWEALTGKALTGKLRRGWLRWGRLRRGADPAPVALAKLLLVAGRSGRRQVWLR